MTTRTCLNRMTLYGLLKDIEAFKNLVTAPYPVYQTGKEPQESLLCFNAIAPVPEEIASGDYNPKGYEWERENWGVHWGAYQVERSEVWTADCPDEHGKIEYTFITPWRPAELWFTRASTKFPRLRFSVYFGSRESHISGYFIISGGKIRNGGTGKWGVYFGEILEKEEIPPEPKEEVIEEMPSKLFKREFRLFPGETPTHLCPICGDQTNNTYLCDECWRATGALSGPYPRTVMINGEDFELTSQIDREIRQLGDRWV